MPKRIDRAELSLIADFVGSNPGGVGAAAIRKGLGLTFDARTLRRRLKLLADEGRIVTTGSDKGKRYFPSPSKLAAVTAEQSEETAPLGLQLCPETLEIQQLILRPVAARTPVPYHHEFLDSYRPNTTAYLQDEIRTELAIVGQVGQGGLPAGTYLRQIMDRLLLDLSWNSSRLEGNTYSLLETQRLLDIGESAEGRTAKETQMILNHKLAIQMLAEQADGVGLNRYTICNLHAQLADNLLPDPAADGRLRTRSIGIAQSVYEPLAVPQQVERNYDIMLQKADSIRNPFEQAFFMMVHLPYLQPFEDVNKRVSRLAANIPLVRENLCPISFVDVEQDDYIHATLAVYELNRIEYLRDLFVWAYRRSCARYSAIRQSLGEPDPFRMRYRESVITMVREVILSRMDKRAATKWISANVQDAIPRHDRPHFIEVVETQLSHMHEGNIARYRLRPSEFDGWQAAWR